METIINLAIPIVAVVAIVFLATTGDEGFNFQVSEEKSERVLSYVTEIKSFPESDARTEFIDYVAKATDDNIIRDSEYKELERLATAARLSDKTSEIKSMAQK